MLEAAYRGSPGYQQPAIDDYGYGDPGYQDPAYDGPRTSYAHPEFGERARPAEEPGYRGGRGYQISDPPLYPGAGYRQDFTGTGRIFPETRAYDPLRGTWDGAPEAGPSAYPDQWYGRPRLDDRLCYDEPRQADQRPGDWGPPAAWQAPAPDYLAAPAAQVGLLMPSAGKRLQGGPLLGAPDTGRTAVRPGHGLDGPEITSSWPAQPQADDIAAFDEIWQDDEDGGRCGLLADDGLDDLRRAGRRGTTRGRPIGRRRGRSRDHRLWLALGGVVVLTAAAIAGILKYEFPSHGGPAHAMVTPAEIGTYVRTLDLERQTHLAELRDEVIKMSSGQASKVVSAVYESGNSAAGGTEQIVMFIGGHLANAAPAPSVADFTAKFPGAVVVGAGTLGGKAACVAKEAGTPDAVSMCAWFDDDSFGVVVSPTMNAASLAGVMRTFRPSVELLAKQ